MALGRIRIPRVWKSEWLSLLLAIVTSVACFFVTRHFASGAPLDSISTALPISSAERLWLLWLIPIGIMLRAAYRIYDVFYSLDDHAIEMRTGRLSWYLEITRIRFEDMRSIETRQLVIDQILGIGKLEIGTAAGSGSEIVFSGIANPRQIQQLVQEERKLRDNRPK